MYIAYTGSQAKTEVGRVTARVARVESGVGEVEPEAKAGAGEGFPCRASETLEQTTRERGEAAGNEAV